jgi:SNF2 family DNA or RNA helicase
MKGEKNNRARAFRTILSSKFNVCITTYDYIIIESNRLTAIEWEYIIVDEGQKLKSKGSKFRNMLIR